MPATYSHEGRVYTRSSIWETPAPKQQERKIFGIDVDCSTFRKYNHQNYSIGFHFTDLAGLEFWATDAEAAKNRPETAAAARQIKERIISEITGKENENMKDPKTAADFIAALNDIYTESRNIYAVLQDKADKAKAKMDKLYDELNDHKCTNKQLAQLRYDTARGEYLLAEEARRAEYREMISGHEKKVAELRVKFSEYLEELYAANPDNLDQSTMKLLESGICSPAELYRLAERHKDNPTMLRIVSIYAEKKREKYPYGSEESATCTSIITAAKAASNGNRELAVFDSAVSAVAYGLDKDFSHATRMHSYVDGWMETFKKQIMNLPVTPAEE